jgi:hypothetical protein
MGAPRLLAAICGILLVALPGTGASCNRGCSPSMRPFAGRYYAERADH